jgi:hypothetical protein
MDPERHGNSKKVDKCQSYGTDFTPHFGCNFLNSMGNGCSEKVCIFSKFFEASSVTLGINFWTAKKKAMNFTV